MKRRPEKTHYACGVRKPSAGRDRGGTYKKHEDGEAEDDRERAHRGGLRLEKEWREQSQPGQSRVGDGGTRSGYVPQLYPALDA